MFQRIKKLLNRNPCIECDFYREENNTCQSKKCSEHGGYGYVTFRDRICCEPYKYKENDDTNDYVKAQREKLIELLSSGRCHYKPNCDGTFCYDEPCVVAIQADYLIDNGVVVLPCRCGECEHRGTDNCPMHIKGVPADEEFLSKVENDFCNYGKRKGGEE